MKLLEKLGSEVGKAECGHRNLEIAGTKELLRLN